MGRSGMGGGTDKSVSDPAGGNIDLSDSPLKYSKKDSTLEGDQRKKVEEFEKEKFNSRREYSRTVDKNGEVVAEHVGDGTHTKIGSILGEDGQVGTHIHPRGPGLLGGTFSDQDIVTLVGKDEFSSIRARAKEGTYYITKKEGFDGKGLLDYKLREREKYINIKHKRDAAIDSMQSKGEITGKRATELKIQSFNKFLVDVHNSMIAGQKKYGYSYGLERVQKKKGRRKKSK